VTNYGEYLDRYTPEFEVEVRDVSSWSCAHGVDRWRRDCGCGQNGDHLSWNQKWREPLRLALEYLRDEAAGYFEDYGRRFFRDPWEARNKYIQLILDGGRSSEEFFNFCSQRQLSDEEKATALTLLEMQHNSLLMFTSCAWFFSELSGIETVQIMKYAARVIELHRQLGLPSPRHKFLELMALARSNVEHKGSGADIYLREVVASQTIKM
jgi:alpha-amylase/alpha-mannosidase (GH57 family)